MLGKLEFSKGPRGSVFLLSFYWKGKFFLDIDEHYTHMAYHFHCTIPPLIRVAVLAPKLNWRKSLGGRSLEILRNAFGTHYRCLTTPQRWEVVEARKSWIFKSPQGNCFQIVFLLKWQVLAPKTKLVEEAWMGDPQKSLETLANPYNSLLHVF